MRYKTIIALIPLILSSFLKLGAQWCNTTVYTPSGVSICAYYEDIAPSWYIEYLEDQAAGWIEDNNSNATRIDAASNQYNCHAYAWHVSEGGNKVWVSNYDDFDNLVYNVDNYFSGSNPSYAPTAQSEADKVFYGYGSADHSAITTAQPGIFKSKWGQWPVYQHAWNDCPYNSSNLQYYKYCYEKIEDQTITTDLNKSSCRLVLKNIDVQNSPTINIVIEEDFKIVGTFNAPTGTVLNINPE